MLQVTVLGKTQLDVFCNRDGGSSDTVSSSTSQGQYYSVTAKNKTNDCRSTIQDRKLP